MSRKRNFSFIGMEVFKDKQHAITSLGRSILSIKYFDSNEFNIFLFLSLCIKIMSDQKRLLI